MHPASRVWAALVAVSVTVSSGIASAQATAPVVAEGVDQTPPTMINGIAVDEEGYLWVCDGTGSELLRLEAPGERIVARYGRREGVDGPDDVVVDRDYVYYTAAFTLAGAVAKLDRREGRATTLAPTGLGTNPIAFAPNGKLYAGLSPAVSGVLGQALGANGLYEVDPVTGDYRLLLADDAGMNAFAAVSDGFVYGPHALLNAVMKVEVETGKIETLLADLPIVASVRHNPRDDRLYVLAGETTQPVLLRMARDGSDLQEFARLSEQPDALISSGDNFAFAPDGTIYVTRFLQPLITRVSADGSIVEDFAVGKP